MIDKMTIERWVFYSDADKVRSYWENTNGQERKDLEAVLTQYISLGDASLTKAFPEFADASPSEPDQKDVMFCSTSTEDFKCASEKVAAAIIANSNVKIVLKMTDEEEAERVISSANVKISMKMTDK